MAKKQPSAKKSGGTQQRASNVSLHPLTPEQAIRGMFQISPKDVKRIVASKPGRQKKTLR
jgi:hypothetical protein